MHVVPVLTHVNSFTVRVLNQHFLADYALMTRT
jgi:hypothetical protein